MDKCEKCGNKCQICSCNDTKYIITKYGRNKEYNVKCSHCNKEIIVVERDKQFPKKEKYFCNRKCANSRKHSNQTKQKISNSLLKTNNTEILRNKDNFPICICCGKIITEKPKRMNYCSVRCFNKLNKQIIKCKVCNKEFETNKLNPAKCCSNECRSVVYKKAGLKSSKIQSETRRSKNEHFFAKLCQEYFKEVETNKQMFNGWDADVIIHDVKIAVLWNGNWHYKKITKKHSISQVQNRDKIKIKEIIDFGYEPYVIKDLGKFNEKFVIKEFEKFIIFIELKK